MVLLCVPRCGATGVMHARRAGPLQGPWRRAIGVTIEVKKRPVAATRGPVHVKLSRPRESHDHCTIDVTTQQLPFVILLRAQFPIEPKPEAGGGIGTK